MLTLVRGRADGSKKAIQDIHNAEDKQHVHAAIKTSAQPCVRPAPRGRSRGMRPFLSLSFKVRRRTRFELDQRFRSSADVRAAFV
ncbi:hypothetical protein QF032_007956 [Streptomyces achromogenes]|uniref:hypothetical protein n=1 Tax=Streptomyces achromogenes TaxID=67255 RepID=UPI00277F44B4|nr:hypothetical protein [Streptomyces achromogenes]MDQ0836112.1 hypothetical protein [Streptomyces achromogenes]